MINYKQILLAEKWNESFEEILKQLARMQNDLDKYKQKPDAKENVTTAKQLTINTITNFVDLTEDLLDAQREILQHAHAYKTLHKKMQERYQILEAFAKTKGVDTSLVDYMHIKDFTI